MKKIRLAVVFFALVGILSLTNCKKPKNKTQEGEIIQDDESLSPSTHENLDRQDSDGEKLPETQESEITE